MRTLPLALTVLAVTLSLPSGVHADHDATDAYTTIAGTIYIDDDDVPYVYIEANGEPGLQRAHLDGNLHRHPGHDDPDHWYV